MKHLITVALMFLFAAGCEESKAEAPIQGPERFRIPRAYVVEPDFKDVRYGPHERNFLDIWVSRSEEPSPLILLFHGGGFIWGDKTKMNHKYYIDAGYTVASMNYRLSETAIAAYQDGARALQFLRHNAQKWNINPRLVASVGPSAGGVISMFLAFHDDLADPQSPDPIARQSTRVTCVAINNAPVFLDSWSAGKIGITNAGYERHPFFLPCFGITAEEIDTPKAHELYKEAAPMTWVSKGDSPILIKFSKGNPLVEVDENTNLSQKIHHPLHGAALKERYDELGIEFVFQYTLVKGGEFVTHGKDPAKGNENQLEFIRRHFDAEAKGENRVGRIPGKIH